MHGLTKYDVKDLGSAALITIPKTKIKPARKFVITDSHYDIFKKYINLRPNNAPPSLFLSYRDGKCGLLQMGINKMGQMGKSIAKFLKLAHPETYTFCSLRKSLNNVNDCNDESNEGGIPIIEEEKPNNFIKKIDKSNMIFGSLDSGINMFLLFIIKYD